MRYEIVDMGPFTSDINDCVLNRKLFRGVINSNTVQEYSGGLNYKGGYWPIPQSAVDASPNINQTAGY